MFSFFGSRKNEKPESPRAREIKDRVKNEGTDQSQKLQQMYVDMKGTAENKSQRIREQAEERRVQAAEKDTSWFKWGIATATEGGQEPVPGKTEEAAWRNVRDLKRELIVTADEMKDLAKDDVKSFPHWGGTNYQKSEVKKVIEEGEVIGEAIKKSTASRNLDASRPMKDNTIVSTKLGLQLEREKAREHAHERREGVGEM